MWHGVWRHTCDDETTTQRETDSERHPIDDHASVPFCPTCGDSFRLVSWSGPSQKDRPVRKTIRRKGGFNAKQLELF